MLLVTCIYGVTTLTTIGTNLPIATKPKILTFLIWETHFFETNILGMTKYSTERACNSRITTGTSIVNIRNKKVTSQLTFLLSHQRKKFRNRWYQFHKENVRPNVSELIIKLS